MSQPLPPETLTHAAERIAISELARDLSAATAAYAAAVQTLIDHFVASRVATHESERTAQSFPVVHRVPLRRDARFPDGVDLRG